MKSAKKDIYTEIKVETDYPQTLKRMMAQNGYCFNMDVDGADLFFECFKNGSFLIQRYNEKNRSDYYSHYLTGKIIDNGETATVRYRIVQQKTPLVLNLLFSIFFRFDFCFPLLLVLCAERRATLVPGANTSYFTCFDLS